MSKFEEYFSEAQSFNNGTYVIDGSLDRVDAALKISLEIGEEVDPDNLERDRVRYGFAYGFAPEYVEDYQDLCACWYTGASGKGSKEVWVLEQ